MNTNQVALLMTAVLLTAAIRAALKNGVRHRTRDGRPLETEWEIIAYLAEEHGEVERNVDERHEVTTLETELECILRAVIGEAELECILRAICAVTGDQLNER